MPMEIQESSNPVLEQRPWLCLCLLLSLFGMVKGCYIFTYTKEKLETSKLGKTSWCNGKKAWKNLEKGSQDSSVHCEVFTRKPEAKSQLVCSIYFFLFCCKQTKELVIHRKNEETINIDSSINVS